MKLFLARRRPGQLAALTAVMLAGGTLAAISLDSAFANDKAFDATSKVQKDFKPIPSFAPLVKDVSPAVVSVTVHLKVQQADNTQAQNGMPPGMPFAFPFPFPQPQQPQAVEAKGSGFFISSDGYIVTNNHVVQAAIDIRVMMSDRKVYSAKLIGTDPLTDLAVIKIDAKNLPIVPWGNSTRLRPGQMVLAFGSPYGLRSTVTRGIISALNRPNPIATNRRKPGEFIQTDAAINEGNSGGALVDANGRLIGINTFLISPTGAFSGMGFAIPTEIVRPTVEALIRDGHVRHGSMGVSISDVTPNNAQFFDVSRAVGAVVTDVTAGSPADRAGVKTGDVITSLDGMPVSDASELQVEVQQHQPGDTIQLGVLRNGNRKTVPITLQSMDQGEAGQLVQNSGGKGRWGVTVSNLTPSARSEMQLPDSLHGAVIEDVRPGSPADDAGLQRGDVLVSVDRKPTRTATEAARALDGVPQGQDVLVLVWSNGGNTFRVLYPSAG